MVQRLIVLSSDQWINRYELTASNGYNLVLGVSEIPVGPVNRYEKMSQRSNFFRIIVHENAAMDGQSLISFFWPDNVFSRH